jgi:DNA-binding response OmpR family regulator
VNGTKVLIVDDEEEVGEIVKLMFANQGAEAQAAISGEEALQLLYSSRPDLVVLDLMMPDMDGWEVCARIRQLTDVPIIMLSALNQEQDIVRGLNAGADDYVTKPFSSNVLMARAHAVMRRKASRPSADWKNIYDDGHLSLNLNKRAVGVGGKPVKLSATEFKLLQFLFQKAGQLCTYEQILAEVWGPPKEKNPEYVHIYIWHLRQKLEQDPKNPNYIVTEHRIGYRFYRFDTV